MDLGIRLLVPGSSCDDWRSIGDLFTVVSVMLVISPTSNPLLRRSLLVTLSVLILLLRIEI